MGFSLNIDIYIYIYITFKTSMTVNFPVRVLSIDLTNDSFYIQ